MSTAPASDPQSPEPAAGARPEPTPTPRPRPKLVFDDPLDQQSSDDTDRGWGERPPAGGSTADLARFLDEKPPHHI
ncbi:hypothetical protein EDD96_4853 [Streptomyces sp. Ag109_G2-6]|uniref:hypothetical protein n=1 Tax=Streptomyces TaxID=1883 RepID=UPI0009A4924A|nr:MULTISPECIES: hypothetical protein [Streptomyces]RPF41064.1 hypothetical protein EDD96_4853 [Streptomyces sp. Ag109_G2-6]